MPEKSIPPGPPLLMLVLAAAVLGLIAQLGVNLALGVAQKKRVLIGMLVLSALLSGGVTLLMIQLTALDDYVCATLGALLGAAPPLLLLRIGLQTAAAKYNVSLTELLTATPADQAGWLATPTKEGVKDDP